MRHAKILLFFAAVVFAVYANALPNAFISDDAGITINAASWNLHTVFAQPPGFLRPLIYLFIYNVAGLAPWAFRIPNILFHLFNVWLLFALVLFLVNRKTAFIAAGLFAVHPIAVESVAWISGGVYAQYTFFLLFSLTAYVVLLKSQRGYWYGVSLIAGALALVSSEKAISLPLILALAEVSFGSIPRNWRRLLPFFLVTAVFVLLSGGLISTRLAALPTTFYQPDTVLRNPLIDIPFAITTYLSLLGWPLSLSLYHPDPTSNTVQELLRGGIALMFLSLTGYSFVKNRRLFFFLAFFVVALAPTLLPFRLAWTVAERYVYLGSIGIIAGAAYVLQQSIKKQRLLWGIVAMLTLLLSFRTIMRNTDWNNEISFWSATAKTAPALPNVHSNLAVALGQREEYEDAIKEFQLTIALKPDWVDPYYNLGLTYQRAGKFASASASYQKALEVNPNLWQPYRNLAEIAFAEKRHDEAINYLNGAIEKNPTNANLFVNLALVYQAKGDIPAAKTAIHQALTIDPTNEAAHKLLQELPSTTAPRR